MTNEFYCIDCKQTKAHESNFTTGYATTNEGKVCYDCVGIRDLNNMRETGKATMYLTSCFVDSNHKEISEDQAKLLQAYGKKVFKRYCVGNWPSSLKFVCHAWKTSKTNWGDTRIDAWFRIGNTIWWARQQGGNNEIARCKATKETQMYYTPSWEHK